MEDGWSRSDVLATEQGAAALERMIDFHYQGLMDQMTAYPQPAAGLQALREGKAVRKAMLAEVGILV